MDLNELGINIREEQERREHQYLSRYASFSDESRGRDRTEEPCPMRTIYQRDRDRIIHCKAFRRLKHKTQVFLAPEGDHYRTRLTHTLEVSQIARSIARALRLNEDLTEAIALGHDLGHTPFGHAGERTLNRLCPEGFSHCRQSIRTVEFLEKDGRGLNLTREVRDGILNHRTEGMPYTLEGKVVRLSDKIAYINHDIDDAIRARIFSENDVPHEYSDILGNSTKTRLNTLINDIVANSYGRDDILMSDDIEHAMKSLRQFMFDNLYSNPQAKAYINHDIDDAIRARIFSENDVPHEYSDILGNSTKTRLNTLINDIVANSYGRDDILMSDDIEHAMKSLRQFMFDNLYSNPQAKAEEVKVYKLITELYNYYVSNPDKLPGNYIRFIEEYNQSKERVVCDYIAGMSDHYAIARFEEIYVPRSWKV